MNGDMLAERARAMIPRYEKNFAERGGITPSDPLEFHLYHLARYWSRLVGFCRQKHAGDDAGVLDVRRGLEVADMLAAKCGPECELGALIDRCALLGCQWGVSDGN